MSMLSIISNCSERLFSYHWNFTICWLVNFFIILISMDCGTLMSTKKDWYREGGKSSIIRVTHNFSFPTARSGLLQKCLLPLMAFLSYLHIICKFTSKSDVIQESWKRRSYSFPLPAIKSEITQLCSAKILKKYY